MAASFVSRVACSLDVFLKDTLECTHAEIHISTQTNTCQMYRDRESEIDR